MNVFLKGVVAGLVTLMSANAFAVERQVWWTCSTPLLQPQEVSWAKNPVGPFHIEIATVGDQYEVRVQGRYGARELRNIDVNIATTRQNFVGTHGENLVNFRLVEDGDFGALIAMNDFDLSEPAYLQVFDGAKSSWSGAMKCRGGH